MKEFVVSVVGFSRLFKEGLELVLRRSRFKITISATTIWDAIDENAVPRPDIIVCCCATIEEAAETLLQLRDRVEELRSVRIVLLTSGLTPDLLRKAAVTGVAGVLSKDITSEVLRRSLELVMLGQQLFPANSEEQLSRPVGTLVPFSRPACNAPHLIASSPASEPNTPSLSGQPSRASQYGLLTPRNVGGSNTLSIASQRHGAAADGQRITTLSQREKQILRCLVAGSANKTIARELDITEATVKVHIKGLLRKIRVNNRTQAAVWGLSNPVNDEDEQVSDLSNPLTSDALRHVAP